MADRSGNIHLGIILHGERQRGDTVATHCRAHSVPIGACLCQDFTAKGHVTAMANRTVDAGIDHRIDKNPLHPYRIVAVVGNGPCSEQRILGGDVVRHHIAVSHTQVIDRGAIVRKISRTSQRVGVYFTAVVQLTAKHCVCRCREGGLDGIFHQVGIGPGLGVRRHAILIGKGIDHRVGTTMGRAVLNGHHRNNGNAATVAHCRRYRACHIGDALHASHHIGRKLKRFRRHYVSVFP